MSRMQDSLETKQARRAKETALTNMTPEERAAYTEEQEQNENEEDIPDLDVFFEYILLLESTHTDDAGDLSRTDFLKPHAGIRSDALKNPLIKRQEEFSSIRFAEANNILESNPDGEGEIRHCKLTGKSYNQDFVLTFDVLEPDLVMDNVNFGIDIEMQLEVGEVFER